MVTENYTTSFAIGIKALDKKYHDAIYAIYGFVRFADEIVDTFHDWDKKQLLDKFRADTLSAIQDRISLNPILHAFQLTYHKYELDQQLIDSFLSSMEMDLYTSKYKQENYNEYIYGSAEVVGLMCLKVFCHGDGDLFNKLKEPARFLGAAFQKVNFLRDLQADYVERGRMYFPEVDFNNFCHSEKSKIEADIKIDFKKAYEGILMLPSGTRFGVYLAYRYYLKLFAKICSTDPKKVMQTRIRVSNPKKIGMLVSAYFRSNVLGYYAP